MVQYQSSEENRPRPFAGLKTFALYLSIAGGALYMIGLGFDLYQRAHRKSDPTMEDILSLEEIRYKASKDCYSPQELGVINGKLRDVQRQIQIQWDGSEKFIESGK